MFLDLAHTKKPVFQESRRFVLECYRITKDFPTDERFAMVQQIRRAALSVHLHIAEGCSRKSDTEIKRFFEISRGSVIEIDTALDCLRTEIQNKRRTKTIRNYLISTFKQLTGLIK